MSVNILDMVKGAVSDQIMGQIGGLLGQSDSKKTSSMFESAVQSFLGGMVKKASSPSGAQDIFRAVQDQDDGLMDKLGDILGGGKQAELEQVGNGALDMVFGDSRGGLLSGIAKFLGLDDGIMGKLMTLAAPIVMGVIGKHIKQKALDAVGLGSLLGEQKSFLSSSMPSGLTSALGFGDFLGGATDAVKDAGSAVADAASDAGRAAANVAGDAVETGGSIMKFLLPLILLAALAILGYTILTGGFGNDQGKGTEGAAATALDDINFGSFDMKGLQEKFTGITDGFKDVTVDNASGLATKISDLTGSIGDMGLDNLTGPAKEAASGAVGKFVDSITSALKGITDDGILGILKPVVDALISRLDPFK